MLFRAPSHLPPLDMLLADLPGDHQATAAHLDISPRSLQRYLVGDCAPRAVQLALFWETRYGLSIIDCELVNAAQVYRGHAQALERQESMLRARICRLEVLGDFGAANLPNVAAR